MNISERIRAMNDRYELEVNDAPTDLGLDRVVKFRSILLEEISELNDVIDKPSGTGTDLVALADLIGDVIVYCRSEACRWGIPIDEVLTAIMVSNESKLGANGEVIKDERGKFLKGPNYIPPEEMIAEIIRASY